MFGIHSMYSRIRIVSQSNGCLGLFCLFLFWNRSIERTLSHQGHSLLKCSWASWVKHTCVCPSFLSLVSYMYSYMQVLQQGAYMYVPFKQEKNSIQITHHECNSCVSHLDTFHLAQLTVPHLVTPVCLVWFIDVLLCSLSDP